MFDNAHIAVPRSIIGMIPSPVVRAFHPKTRSSCSPSVATSQPVFSCISGSREKFKKALYLEVGSLGEATGNCMGRFCNKVLSWAMTEINCKSDICSAGGYWLGSIAVDRKSCFFLYLCSLFLISIARQQVQILTYINMTKNAIQYLTCY